MFILLRTVVFQKKNNMLKQCQKEVIYENILAFAEWWFILWLLGGGEYILADGGWWWIYFGW